MTRQMGSTPKRPRWDSMKPVISCGDGRAPARNRARRLEDLVGPPQLGVLLAKRFEFPSCSLVKPLLPPSSAGAFLIQ